MLDLKAMTAMSWTKMRKLKQWLLNRGITTGGEKATRKILDGIIDGMLQGNMLPLQSFNEIEKAYEFVERPVVTVHSITSTVIHLLEQYYELDELIQLDTLPKDEVWVKLGGDKGGDTFKMMIQIANVRSPNCLRNTQVVALFPGQDSAYNLEVTMKEMAAEVEVLQSTTWREKKVRLFFFGDYEFLCKAYGISGASGRHCCLFCTATKAEIKKPLSERDTQQRDLESMEEDLEKFKIRNVPKECNNVVRKPLFRIPLNQICPPGLHLSLGIFLKHFNALEHQCHALDLEAASILASGDIRNSDDAFSRFITKKQLTKKISELEEEHKDLLDQHLYMSLLYPDSQPVALLQETAQEKRTEMKKLEAQVSKIPEMTEGQGPIVKALDGVLQTINVKRQAYHGKSFVGNHVHKCLKEENIDKITNTIIEKTNEVCPVLCEKAKITAKKYNTLLKLYGSCHIIFNSARVLTMEEISKLDTSIKDYMSFFRANFQDSITPKMHILEDHVMPWSQRWRVGLGLLGEQGGEGMHVHLNNIRSNLRGFTDELTMHMQSVKSQWAYSNPLAYHKNK
nr:uncharacterized protein LOC129271647 [Lytechinus pictus]